MHSSHSTRANWGKKHIGMDHDINMCININIHKDIHTLHTHMQTGKRAQGQIKHSIREGRGIEIL